MNKRGSALVLSIITVLVIMSLSMLIMGLVLTSISLQKRNETELIAHLELENRGYDYLNTLKTKPFEDYNVETEEYTVTLTEDKYTLIITFKGYFASDGKWLYEITGWELTKNG